MEWADEERGSIVHWHLLKAQQLLYCSFECFYRDAPAWGRHDDLKKLRVMRYERMNARFTPDETKFEPVRAWRHFGVVSFAAPAV
jgi:hypothetical protein